jgi:hypothetical protein
MRLCVRDVKFVFSLRRNTMRLTVMVVAAAVLLLAFAAAPVAAKKGGNQDAACWGQASAVFARMGEMGEHSSSFETPRLGLRNLARALYNAGAIPNDSMAALGQFVAAELGLSIEACR